LIPSCEGCLSWVAHGELYKTNNNEMINIKPFKKNKVLTHVQTSHPFFSIIQQANRGRAKEFQASLQTRPDSDIYEEATEITVVSSSDSFNL
jgi:hypothetical protein